MKKIAFLFIPILLLGGCQKDFNNVVDSQAGSYGVVSVNDFKVFTYSPQDSLIPFHIKFTSSTDIKSVSLDIFSPDGNQINAGPVQMYDDGNLSGQGDSKANDNTYSTLYPFEKSFAIGNYQVKFRVTDKYDNTSLAAIQTFRYENAQKNVAPVISDLTAPDTVAIGSEDTYIFLSVAVSDSNGLNDIASVFFNSFIPPDGHPSSQNPFSLNDNGDSGDKVAGDGIYSLTVVLPPQGVTKGTYRWEFQAKDRSGALSNKIIHNIVIK